jgi:hypothetical protein
MAASSCGGDDGGDSAAAQDGVGVIAAEDAVAAFEDAAGGYKFEESTTLADGATAYAPVSSPDPEVVAPVNKALGDGSILWQLLVFESVAPPLDADAAKAAAFSSNRFEEVEPGIYLGDSDIAYVPHGNLVITGPVLDGNVDDPTLVNWKAVLDGL